MRFTVDGEIAAPLADVWAWWTDFGKPGDVFRMKHGLGSSTRTIESVTAETVVFADKSAIGNIRRTVRIVQPHTLVETGEGGQQFESTWTFEAIGSGRTRVTRTMRVRARAVYGPITRAITRFDLRYHCREAERELRGSRA